MKKIFSFLTLAAALLCSGNAWATDVADKDAFFNAVTTGGSVRLTDTIDLGQGTTQSLITIANDLSIDLNGFALKGNGQYYDSSWQSYRSARFFQVNSGKTLTITGTGKITQYGNGGSYLIYKSGTVNINPSNTGTIEFKVAGTSMLSGTNYNITGGRFQYSVQNNINANEYQCVKTGDWYVVSPLPYICTVNGDSLKTIAAALTAAKVDGVITYPIILCKDASYSVAAISEAYEFQGSDYTLTVSGKKIYAGTYKCKMNSTINGGYFENTVSGSIYGGIHNTLPTLPANYSTITTSDSKYYVANTWKLDTENNKVIDGAHFMDISDMLADGKTLLYSASRTVGIGRWFVAPDSNLNVNKNKIFTGYYKDEPSNLMETGYNYGYAAGYYFVGIGVNSDNSLLVAGTFDFNPENAVPGSVHTSYHVDSTSTPGKYIIQINDDAKVAKVKTTYYPSLSKAVTNASSGDTVTLLKDIEGNFTCDKYNSTLTLDLKGKTISSTSGITLTATSFTNLIIMDSEGDGSISAATGGTALSVGNGNGACKVTLNNVDISGTTAITAKGGSSNSKTARVEINEGKYTGNLTRTGTTSRVSYYITAGIFTVNPQTAVNATGPEGVGVSQTGPNEWTVEEISYTVTAGYCSNGYVLVDGQEESTVSAGKSVSLTAFPADDYKFVTFMANGTAISGNTYTPTEDGVSITATFIAKNYICQIGTDGAKFETLKEASQAVEANQTIYLIKDYVTSKIDTLETRKKNVVVDLNSKSITFNDYAGMEVNGRLTLKNGSINGNANYLIYTNVYDPTAQIAARSPLIFENLTMNGGFNMENTDATYINCTIDASTKEYYALYTDPYGTIGCSITIKSGYYAGKSQFACLNANPSPMTITGGTFNSEPNDSWIAEYYSKEQEGGLWRVVKQGTRPSVTLGNIGTICLPAAVAAGDYTNATFYQIAYKDNGKIFFDEVDHLEAGKAYVFEPTVSGDVTYKMSGKVVDTPIAVNGLIGTLVDMNYDPDNKSIISEEYDGLEDMYLVSGNKIQRCGLGCALPAQRAYIDMKQVPEKNQASAPAPGRRRISLIYDQVNTPTGVVDVNENANANGKFIINGKLVIIRDGKKFNAQGARL